MKTAVAMALYNGEKFIERQLDTLRMQSKPADQVILCDDGSKDSTVEKVRAYIEKYALQKCWHLYENAENLGYIKNFYKAMQLCSADVIFLSDQDDVWKADKLEKMCEVMETHSEIALLSCKYGIIDANENQKHSIVETTGTQTNALQKIEVKDILREYRWPGMAMCVRNDFLQQHLQSIQDCKTAHDLTLAMFAATEKAFYVLDYVGVYHRRHDNNAAREEHRVSKLLNRQRKLADIAITIQQWESMLEATLPIGEENLSLIKERLALLKQREEALQEKSWRKVWRLYTQDKGSLLRVKSFLCDIWLVCFGK